MITDIKTYSDWRNGELETNSLSTAQIRSAIDLAKKVGIGALAAGALYGVFKLYKWLDASSNQSDDVEDLLNATMDAIPIFMNLKSKIDKADKDTYEKAVSKVSEDWDSVIKSIQSHDGQLTQTTIKKIASVLNIMLDWISAYDAESLKKLAKDYSVIKVSEG